MPYLALYRRFRPDNFDKVIGQDHIVKTLVNQIKTNRVGHAYLFTGTRGTGKTTIAKIFAKAINCVSPVNGSPCGECEVCKALADPSNVDIVEIDAASNNGVNEIRDLREKVQYPPVTCKKKVYIVDEVHMLTQAAFNALLKTLEEPPQHVVFIFATTEVHKIPATILSRCMRFDFRLVSTEKIASLISNVYDIEGKKYEKEAVYAIASAGEGSVRDSLSIADTALSYSSSTLTYDDVMEILGSTNAELFFEFTKSILNGNTGKSLEIVDNLCSLGKSMGILTKDVIQYIRNLILIKTCNRPNDILLLPENKFNLLKELATNATEERLIRILEIFSETETTLKYTISPRIVFETSVIKASRPDTDYDKEALLTRIKELETKALSGAIVSNSVSGGETISKLENTNVEVSSKKESTLDFYSATISEIKGKLLLSLRQSGSEMLWNILQNVEITKNANILNFTTKDEGDVALISCESSKEDIFNALKDYLPFDINVKRAEENIKDEEIDNETEKIKKIFGDDIVIIKND